MSHAVRIYAMSCLVLLMAGCGSRPRQAPPQSDGVLFRHPAAACHAATLDALSVLGFDVEENEPDYVEGVRPRRANLLWGNPGGERVKVRLKSVAPDETRVVITTQKSFVGLIGQKNWDRDVAQQMTETLGR